MSGKFTYEKTLKTKPGESFLNLQQYLFITSGTLTRLFYYTNVSPHQVILLSMIFGLAGSYFMIQPSKYSAIAGALLLFYKNVLDKVDGSLARAKGLDSRRGRFYDSISDFIVTLASFTAITYHLYFQYHSYYIIIAGFTGMIFSMLQCSYFIYYQVSFIKQTGKDTVNRITEEVTLDDIHNQDKWTTFLQRVFQLIYGWQDRLFYSLDKMLLNRISDKLNSTLSMSLSVMRNPASAGQNTQTSQVTQYTLDSIWYKNKPFLTLASSLSIGTHIFLICISAILGRFYYYIFVNLILMNLLLIFSIIYHYRSTINKLKNK